MLSFRRFLIGLVFGSETFPTRHIRFKVILGCGLRLLRCDLWEELTHRLKRCLIRVTHTPHGSRHARYTGTNLGITSPCVIQGARRKTCLGKQGTFFGCTWKPSTIVLSVMFIPNDKKVFSRWRALMRMHGGRECVCGWAIKQLSGWAHYYSANEVEIVV